MTVVGNEEEMKEGRKGRRETGEKEKVRMQGRTEGEGNVGEGIKGR